MSLNERDMDVLARTIWGEARGEGIAGQIAAGWPQRFWLYVRDTTQPTRYPYRITMYHRSNP